MAVFVCIGVVGNGEACHLLLGVELDCCSEPVMMSVLGSVLSVEIDWDDVDMLAP